MLQVLIAGLIALASKWLLDGGIRRRDRHVIREELELADILGDRSEAQQLRASAEARLQRYLRPPFTTRAAPVLRSTAIFLVCLAVGLIALRSVTDEQTSDATKATTALVFGALAAVLAIAMQRLVDGLVRLHSLRARIAAEQRAWERSA